MAGNSENQQAPDQAKNQDFESLVRRVTERVWELWREDLRRNRERRADLPRK
jgi:hypothetical protein